MLKRLLLIPFLLVASSLFAQSISVTFTASTSTPTGPAGIGYNLYRGTTSGGESSTPLNSTPYQCTTACKFINAAGVVPGTTYYYYIKTVDLTSTNMSVPSMEVDAMVAVAAPNAPTNVVATPSAAAITRAHSH